MPPSVWIMVTVVSAIVMQNSGMSFNVSPEKTVTKHAFCQALFTLFCATSYFWHGCSYKKWLPRLTWGFFVRKMVQNHYFDMFQRWVAEKMHGDCGHWCATLQELSWTVSPRENQPRTQQGFILLLICICCLLSLSVFVSFSCLPVSSHCMSQNTSTGLCLLGLWFRSDWGLYENSSLESGY